MPRNYPVITSKAAQNDLNKIKGIHADLLTGMANQATKVANFQQNKQAEVANRQIVNSQIEAEKMTANTQAQKSALDFAQKQSEIDIKRAQMTAA